MTPDRARYGHPQPLSPNGAVISMETLLSPNGKAVQHLDEAMQVLDLLNRDLRDARAQRAVSFTNALFLEMPGVAVPMPGAMAHLRFHVLCSTSACVTAVDRFGLQHLRLIAS